MLLRPARLPLVFLLAAIGCDSTETGGSGTQTGAASIKITSPASGACVDVPIDRTVYVPVTIETTGLTLQPPGVCQAAVSCGNVVLFVDGVRNNAGAATVIDLISTPDKPLSGTIALKASVIGDDGVELVSTDGKAVTAEITFVAKAACDGSTSGTGGATGGTGGATGGTGGATGGTGGATGGTGGATGGTGGATGGTGGATGGTGGATGGTGGTGGATGGTGGGTTSSSGGSGGMTASGGTGGV